MTGVSQSPAIDLELSPPRPARRVASPALPAADSAWALFLDVDGTLLDIAPTPDAVVVSPALRRTLTTLHEALGGALALISGRSVADLDRLFAPLQLPIAGLHGAEWRDAAGHGEVPLDPAAVARLQRDCAALARRFPGVLVEDKGRGVAMHWRRVPALAMPLRAAVDAIANHTGWAVQPGKCVYELKPRGVDKGGALRRLCQTAPFAGRRPLFIGDDLTDAYAATAAQAAGGMALRVGETLADVTAEGFASPAAVREWLQGWAAQLEWAALERTRLG